MSCYNPVLGIPEEVEVKNGVLPEKRYKLGGKYDPSFKIMYPGAIPIPCGHCIGCRLDQSRSWADRMMLELQHTGKAIFLTLTYDNDHVPISYDDETGEFTWFSLDKRDFQLFMKRLRKHFSDKELRFYAAGEYGDNTFRPHYHAIIFGLSLADFPDRVLRGKNELGQCHFSSNEMERIWNNGFILLAEVSWKTCAYVARYVQKKVYKDQSVGYYSEGLSEPEFSLCSRRPGLGYYYLKEHPEIFDLSKIFVPGVEKGMQIPKYFLRKLKDEPTVSEKKSGFILQNEELFDKMMQERKKFAEDRMLLKLQQTDLSYLEMLEQEQNAKLRQASALKRYVE